jgi:hypothetical protein
MKLQTKILIGIIIALLIVAVLVATTVLQANKPTRPEVLNCNSHGGLCETSCDPTIGSLPNGTCKDNLVCCKVDVSKQTN